MSIVSASDVIDAITPEVLIRETDMNQRLIRHIRREGLFAGHWYLEVKTLCEANGIHCPLSAFNWKVSDKKVGNSDDVFQGASK